MTEKDQIISITEEFIAVDVKQGEDEYCERTPRPGCDSEGVRSLYETFLTTNPK